MIDAQAVNWCVQISVLIVGNGSAPWRVELAWSSTMTSRPERFLFSPCAFVTRRRLGALFVLIPRLKKIHHDGQILAFARCWCCHSFGCRCIGRKGECLQVSNEKFVVFAFSNDWISCQKWSRHFPCLFFLSFHRTFKSAHLYWKLLLLLVLTLILISSWKWVFSCLGEKTQGGICRMSQTAKRKIFKNYCRWNLHSRRSLPQAKYNW